MEVIPTGAALGAEVRCGDLRKLDATGIAALRKAWLDHLVVLVRDQEMSDADLVAFGRGFGDFQYSNPLPSPLAMEGKVRQRDRDERYPEVTVVSNIVVGGVAQGGLGDDELVWHSDMSSFEEPPNQTILHSIEVPPSGGNTGFNNMYLACETLPASMRARIDGLSLKHDATRRRAASGTGSARWPARTACSSSVCPSGAARATAEVPIVVPPPGRLSLMNGCLR